MLHIHWKPRQKTIAQELQNFFGKELFQFPITRRSFSPVDLPNLQMAIDQFAVSLDHPAVTLGYTSYHGDYQNSLRELIAPTSYASLGPVQFRDVDIDTENHIQCVENGIFLVRFRNGKVAAHIRGENYMTKGSIELEVMSDVPELAAQFIEQIRETIVKSNIYRSKILSLECDQSWGARGVNQVRFHQLPEVRREEIILPEQTLHLLERNTIHFARHADVLKRSGRSLKRGLLLHGKPGTGKTHSIRWLTHALKGTTVILLSGEQLWLIKECCQMARLLAPSLVVLEDVDLIAAERDEARHPYYQINLHQLLNEMDGLSPDCEVLFILTTNRPASIEPALSLRPGRIDQAIEFPLPDAACRFRLFDLYGQGLKIEPTQQQKLVDKTAGASPAFIKEFLRKASIIAADSDSTWEDKVLLKEEHFDAALEELLIAGGEVTRNLLGFASH